MRKEIYLAIIDCLKNADIGVKHISLWNENTTELERENGYDFPAVFVEFSPLQWKQQMAGVKTAKARVCLHIVTKTMADPSDGSTFQNEALETFDTISEIVATVQGLSGEGFNKFQHIETLPDHNYEEVQHNVEIFTTEVTDTGAVRKRAQHKIQKTVIR